MVNFLKMGLKAFLESVDDPARDESFIAKALEALGKNQITVVQDLVGLEFTMLTEASGAVASFIVRAIKKVNPKEDGAPAAANAPGPAISVDTLAQALRKDEKPLVHIDMKDKLSRRTLGDLDQCVLPDGALVDDLGSQLKRLRNKGVKEPFVAVDLTKWLPAWCHKGGEVPSEDDQSENPHLRAIAKAMGTPAKPVRRLSILEWSIAFDQHALAASACLMWQYPAAITYKQLILEIAINAPGKGRRSHLATIYDELARKEFARLAYSGTAFDVNQASRVVDQHIMSMAEAKYDNLQTERQSKKSHSWGHSSYQTHGSSYGKRSWGNWNNSEGKRQKRNDVR